MFSLFDFLSFGVIDKYIFGCYNFRARTSFIFGICDHSWITQKSTIFSSIYGICFFFVSFAIIDKERMEGIYFNGIHECKLLI